MQEDRKLVEPLARCVCNSIDCCLAYMSSLGSASEAVWGDGLYRYLPQEGREQVQLLDAPGADACSPS